MGKASPALTSFAGGEQSPQLEGRIDVDKYAIGCHVMENFHCLVQGPAQKRAGTRFVVEVEDSTQRTWLRRFEFSTSQAFQIEFGHLYCRFYTNHGQVQVSGVAAWNGGTAYVIGDLVSNGGINYYCKYPHTGHAPPSGLYWKPLTGTIYEIPSPYTYSDLTASDGTFALQFEQSGDVLYIASTNYQPYTLTRYGNTNWVMAAFAPVDGPFLEMNPANGVTSPGIALYASAASGSVTIKAKGGNVFASTDVGRLLRLQVQSYNIKPWESGVSVSAGDLRSYNGNNYKALNSATTGSAPPVNVSGTQWDGAGNVLWQYTDSGYGIAIITAYTSATQVTALVQGNLPADVVGTEATITGVTQASPAVVTAGNSFAIGDPVFISDVVGMTELNGKSYTLSAVSGTTFTLSGVDSTAFTAWSSGGIAVKNATVYWQLGAWGTANSTAYSPYFPRTVCFFNERLFWGGGLRWVGSVPGAYNSYAGDVNGQVTTDCAVSGVLSAQDVNTIVWMSAAQILLIGTQGGEFGLSKITTTNPLGPDNIQVVRQSKEGCKPIRPELVGTSLFYVQRAGRRIMAMDYNFYIDRYESTNQNRLAYHLTQGGITSIAWQAQPFETLWGVRSDGVLVGYTYDKADNVTGWHRQVTNGVVESVSVTPAPDGTRDEVWLIVNRTINGSTKRYIEYIEKPYESGDTQASCFYVDCGLTYSGAATTVISGLDHLEGETVTILADGAVQPTKVVSSGSITLETAASVVNVGLGFTATLVTNRIEGGADVGTSQGKTKRVTQGAIRLVDTCGGKVGMEDGQLDNIKDNDPAVLMGSPPPIYSGDVTGIIWPGDYESDCRLQVVSDQPYPMTIVALFPNLQTNEPT